MLLFLPGRKRHVGLCIELETLDEADGKADLDPAEVVMPSYIIKSAGEWPIGSTA